MKEIKESLMITLDNEIGVPMYVCRLDYFLYEDETYRYEFRPNYKVIDLLNNFKGFQGIPGLNLDLRKDVYIRENRIPTYISERVPQRNRENLYELLEEVGLKYYDPIEYLLRTKYQYFGDKFYNLKPIDTNLEVHFSGLDSLGNNIKTIYYKIMKEMGKGNDLIFNSFKINSSNYNDVYNLLLESLLKINKPLLEAKSKAGRKRKQIDFIKEEEILNKYLNKEILASDAIKELEVSESTFYRMLKKYKNNI